jgi:phenylacetate-CoA ligase
MRLEHTAQELGMDLQRDFPRLHGVFVGGGGWGVRWAQERAARWNVRLHEVYASSQRIFAYSCEWGILRGDDRGPLHFMSHLGLAEIIDPSTGAHVRDNEEGEIVITPFGMTASPLVRYGTGDRARFYAGGCCACGRQFEGIEAGSVGRVDDMLRIKEINVWPEAIDDVIFARPEVVEYRGDLYVDPSGREIARILMQCRPEVPSDTRTRLYADLATAIQRRVGIHFLVESWEGESLVDGMTGLSFDLKTRRRWNDRRAETREAAPTARS